MNVNLLDDAVQAYINTHMKSDVGQIALGKSTFDKVSAQEIAGQVAAKQKSIYKLPIWANTPRIYFPSLLSIEQCSSEKTAAYKASLAIGYTLIDVTSGFGVDSYYFSKNIKTVYSCEINSELSTIAAHNASVLGATNINQLTVDGIQYLTETEQHFDTIYIDPARRLNSGKVFKLSDCTPNVVVSLPLLLEKAKRIIIKTAPLLDISAGLAELSNVSEIHIISVKNECKELLWILDRGYRGMPVVHCITLNETSKSFSFNLNEMQTDLQYLQTELSTYLYEPDVALLKSGAFNLIGNRFNLQKLSSQSHLYTSDQANYAFPGRVFKINEVYNLNDFKKLKNLKGNVVVRNFPDKAANLTKKYKVKADHDIFIIFTQVNQTYTVILCTVLQHY